MGRRTKGDGKYVYGYCVCVMDNYALMLRRCFEQKSLGCSPPPADRYYDEIVSTL